MDHIANNDVLAWSLLGVLGLTLGMVSACGWGIYRQFRKPSPESELIQEIMESQKRISPDAGPVPGTQNIPPRGNDWERPAGWWKSPPQD